MLLVAVFTSSCKKDDPEPTKLNVTISQQPSGGNNMSSVSVKIEGIISGTVKPIDVTLEWWWENGYHTDQKLKSSTQFNFNSNSTTSKSSVWPAASGYYLLNYYWVKITWTDDSGAHSLESAKAYCGT